MILSRISKPLCLQRAVACLPRAVALCLLLATTTNLCAIDNAVYSEPVGFLKVSIPAAQPQKFQSKLVGIPFQRASVFTGTISGAGTNFINCSESGWVASQFTSSPHFLKILSGNAIGCLALITLNTADTISFDGQGLPLSAGDHFTIFPAHTLAALFNPPRSSGLVNEGTGAESANLVRTLESGSWTSHFHDGANWRAVGGTGPKDTKIIGPDQAAFIINRGSSEVSVTLLGSVSVGTETNSIAGAGLCSFAPRFPVRRSLKELGIHLYSGWRKAATASLADSLLLWSENAWRIYYHNGDHWLSVGSFANQDDTGIEAGQGVAILRKAVSPGTAGVFKSTGWFSYQLSD